ncbi:winged helix-turn-helix transcriptional regulator [Sphingomonas jatrophae]|uniref:Transcriptional regulator, HxlR family n=1 Tax=Sphingomonas jatrophae TaxID=1166337 RepID=A0A1I6LI96_9SPHN|nr:helix-turn-helix domain-containing protein [Sphingomonas jatrophae]SFS03050.1 transcriptional regulator, HxlR family [Sphingomonas jatrophae]
MKSQKLTDVAAGRSRWYDDACGTAHALELVGERWSLLILRELMFGARRFSELRRALPGISANVLTQRLVGLEQAGLLVRRLLPSPANVAVYELTPWGYEAEEPIKVLGRWAVRSPDHDPTLPLSAASLMMSFRTMFDAGRAAGLEAVIGFDLGAADRFVATIGQGAIAVVRGDCASAGLRLTGTPEQVGAIVYGGAAAQDVGVRVDGDAPLLARFAQLFPLPEKAGIAPGAAAQ